MKPEILTAIIAAVIAIIFAAIIIKIIIDKKKGKHSCSCGGNCQTCGICTKYTATDIKNQENEQN